MAGRIRTIKPELLDDAKTAKLTDRQWRLFVSLLLLADDYGNMHGDVRRIDAAVFWGSSGDSAELLLSELKGVGLIQQYEVGGQAYIHLTGWTKHQKVDKPGKPRVPGPLCAGETQEAEKATYFIRSVATGLIKIGSSVDPVARLMDLTRQSADHLELVAIGGSERALHSELADSRVHGEWFRPSPPVLAKIREFGGNLEDPIATAGYVDQKRVLDNRREDPAKGRVDLAPDLRPPTSDLRPGTSDRAPSHGRGNYAGEPPPGFSEPGVFERRPAADVHAFEAAWAKAAEELGWDSPPRLSRDHLREGAQRAADAAAKRKIPQAESALAHARSALREAKERGQPDKVGFILVAVNPWAPAGAQVPTRARSDDAPVNYGPPTKLGDVR
jgi:hypothetical protein